MRKYVRSIREAREPCLLLTGFNACQLLSLCMYFCYVAWRSHQNKIFYVALLLTLLMQVPVNYLTSSLVLCQDTAGILIIGVYSGGNV